MVRRRLTISRLDPWSVLKFGAVANLALVAIGLLCAAVVWFIVERLRLVDQVCEILLDVGFTQCGVNAGNLFRALLLLGLLWAVVQTAVLVFLSFLHNLIADLVGGLTVTVLDDTPGAAARGEAVVRRSTTQVAAASGVPTAEAPTTGRPPVPPLRRDPEADEQHTRPHRPVPDPDAPGRRGGQEGDLMFGERSTDR